MAEKLFKFTTIKWTLNDFETMGLNSRDDFVKLLCSMVMHDICVANNECASLRAADFHDCHAFRVEVQRAPEHG